MTDYTLSYTRLLSFVGNYTRDYILTRSSSYSRNFAGEYTRDYTRTRVSAYTRGRESAYAGQYARAFTRDRSSAYTRGRESAYAGQYARAFTRNRASSYSRTRFSVTSITFDVDYFSRTLSYTPYYSRVRTSNFLRDYVAYYGTSFSREITRSSEVITCTVFYTNNDIQEF